MAGKIKDRTGETNTNNTGHKMTITEYFGVYDITVMFEDGKTREHMFYSCFKKGYICHPDSPRIQDRTGETNLNASGLLMKIVNFRNVHDIDIEFEDGYVAKNRRYNKFKDGSINNPYYCSLHGVGYYGDTSSEIYKKYAGTKAVTMWKGMIKRSFSKLELKHKIAQRSNEVSEDFKCLVNFLKFYDENAYYIGEELALDKDLLSLKGRRLYSSETCCLLPDRLNNLINVTHAKQSSEPTGVCKRENGQFGAKVLIDKKPVNLGTFDTPEEAFLAYKTAKEAYVKQVADEYKEKYPQFPKKVYDALYAWTVPER